MEKNKKAYEPIDCGLYDHYEVYAMRRTLLSVTYKEGEKTVTNSLIIKTLRALNGEEFLLAEDGTEIRLDRIIEMKPVA
ncbi:hypothetical protein [Sanyastnella coralliicola]|uniref:hypothetical protein n=1 Tax=Sanyastnella coralliicola TaxID=3069118 RepID=UPI0027BAC995|nr:hypothetical protein [Longitalea sp. SCSIO 12813]